MVFPAWPKMWPDFCMISPLDGALPQTRGHKAQRSRAIRVAASDSAKDSASADSRGRSASRAPTLYANMIEQHHEIDQLLSRLVQAVAHINGPPERAQARRL